MQFPRDGAEAEIEGWMAPMGDDPAPRSFLLVPQPACCGGCPADPATAVEVIARGPVPRRAAPLRLAGRWRRLPPDDPTGWLWQLRDARIVGGPAPGPWLARRALLAAPLACGAVAGCVPAAMPAESSAAARDLLATAAPADLHSHAGRVILGRDRVRSFEPLAAPMREGSFALVALAMVADTPTTRVMADGRIQAVREPAPGELRAHGEAAFARLAALVSADGLAVVTNQASLAAATRPGGGPAVVVAAEGADFLEGELAGLEPTFRAHRLRHLQLVHYRVNALGDIQTVAPVHNGLTEFGAAVIRACERLGILVDVAHGTFDLVRRAVEVASKPLVLSHTALIARPVPFGRSVTAEHARLVARVGGVVGIWPPAARFPTLRDYAEGIARAADAIGVEHVGIGSDMQGLTGPSVYDSYRETPALAEALLAAGFRAEEARKVLGGNYARVLAATLPA